MSFSFVLCRPTGEPLGEALQAQKRSLDLLLNGVHTAHLGIPVTDPLAAEIEPGASRMKVYRSPSAAELAADPGAARSLVFYGSLPAQNVREEAKAGLIDVTFADPRWVLAHRYILGVNFDAGTPPVEILSPTNFIGLDQGEILWQVITLQNTRLFPVAQEFYDTWIRQGSTTTGIVRDRIYDAQLVSTIFEQMTQVIDGPDVDITARDGYSEATSSRIMADLQVYARQGSDRPDAQFLFGQGYASNVDDMRRTYQPVTTQATLVGTATDGKAPHSRYSAADGSVYGLLEEYGSDSDVSDVATLASKTRGTVESGKTPREVIEIMGPTPDAPRPFEDYYLGDTIRASCRKGSMVFTDRELRVHGFQIALDQTGEPAVTLTTATA